MADWTYTLGLDSKPFVEGAKAAEAAEKQMASTIKADAAATAAAVREQGAAMQQVSGASGTVTTSMQQLANAARTARTELAEKAAKMKTASQYMREMGEAGQAAKGGFANAGQGLLQAAYAADDLQYGLRGVMNNVPSLIQGLGGTAGLAGAAGIALVAFQQLGGYIMNEFKKSWDWISGETERLDLEKLGESRNESHKRALARLVGESGQKGDREAESVGKVIEAEQAYRAKAQARLDEKKAALEAETELAKAKAEGIQKAGEKAVALNDIEKKATMDKLQMEKQFYQERLNNLKASTGVTGDRHADEARLRKLQEEKRDLDLIPEDERNEKQRRRAAEIGGAISAEQTRTNYARGAFDADSTALKRVEAEIANAIKRAQAGDIRTGRIVEDEKWAEQEKARKDAVRKRNERDDWDANQQKAADAKSKAGDRDADRRKRLSARAEMLTAQISDREAEDDDDGAGAGGSRGGRGPGAQPSRRIKGAISAGSYQRDRYGNAMRMSRETRDPRINQRAQGDGGKQSGDVKLEQMRRLLADIKSELKRSNNNDAKQ